MTTWTKCSDRMPPDNDTDVILRNKHGQIISLPGYIVHLDPEPEEEWTFYNWKLWDELNKCQ